MRPRVEMYAVGLSEAGSPSQEAGTGALLRAIANTLSSSPLDASQSCSLVRYLTHWRAGPIITP